MKSTAVVFEEPAHASILLMHQLFVFPAPTGPRNRMSFDLSVCKALLNALHSGEKFMVKALLKAPASLSQFVLLEQSDLCSKENSL